MEASTHARAAAANINNFELTDLVAPHVEPCISIYTSDCWASNGAGDCLPKFAGLLRAAAPQFQDTLMTVEEAQALLTSHWRAMDKSDSVFANSRGLAVFMSRDSFAIHPLPVTVASHITVGRQFLVRPLLPFTPRENSFFVLALSQKHVRLFEGSRRGIHERKIRDVPANLHEDLQGVQFERQYQMHTAAPLGTHQKGAIFHGPSVHRKDRLLHFFRDVDRGVAESLKGQQKPLILAAVDYLLPIYKEANSYPHLLDEMIDGNPDLLSPATIHSAAWRIMEGEAARTEARGFAVYHEHVNTPLTSSNLRDVLAAAERGIVRFLFVRADGDRWGSFASPAIVHLHAKAERGDEELLNLASILTIRHGGYVYVVPPEKLPEGADLAAVFRFGLTSHVAV